MAQDIQSTALAPTENEEQLTPGGGTSSTPPMVTTPSSAQSTSSSSPTGQPGSNSSQPSSGLIQPKSNSAQASSGPAPVANTPEKTPANNGTGFVNLQQYLNANQGNQLGTAVAGNINNAANTANTNLSTQQAAFSTGLQNARSGTTQDQQNVSGIMNDINSSNFSGLTAPQIQSYQQDVSTPYQGPTGYSNTTQLQQQAANATALGQLAGSGTGRQQLLNQTINSPNYTNAESNMDQLFLSLGGGNQAVQKAAQGTQQLGNQVNSQIAAAQAQGNAAQTGYQNFQNQAVQGVSSQNNATNAAIANAVQAAQAQQTGVVQPLQAGLANNTLTAAQAQSLGLGSDYGQSTYGVNLGQYLTAQPTPTAANVATAQQQAQLTALAQLSGNQVPTFDTTQTGTYNSANPYSYNTSAAQQAIAQQQAAYQTAQAQIIPQAQAEMQQYINSIPGGAASIKPGTTEAQLANLYQSQGDTSALTALEQQQAGYVNNLQNALNQQYSTNTILGNGNGS